jgi:uncharacterized protein YlxW (UPF0749 family)
MPARRWFIQLCLTAVFFGLGLALVVQLRTLSDMRQAGRRLSTDWEYVVTELIDSNTQLRDEIETLQGQLAELQDVEGGGVILESLVDEVNRLRTANGLVTTSGPGVEVEIGDPVSVLDLHDLVNELRNAGAEAMALNGYRIVAWSAISTNGETVTVDGRPVYIPYRLEAIGDAATLEVALGRPGGLVSLLRQARPEIAISVQQREKVTLAVYDQPLPFVYAQPVD